MKQKLGVMWQGFQPETVRGWLAHAGLRDPVVEVSEPPQKSSELPATFIATATKPAPARARAKRLQPGTDRDGD